MFELPSERILVNASIALVGQPVAKLEGRAVAGKRTVNYRGRYVGYQIIQCKTFALIETQEQLLALNFDYVPYVRVLNRPDKFVSPAEVSIALSLPDVAWRMYHGIYDSKVLAGGKTVLGLATQKQYVWFNLDHVPILSIRL